MKLAEGMTEHFLQGPPVEASTAALTKCTHTKIGGAE